MPDYMKPDANEVEAVVDAMIQTLAVDFEVDVIVLKDTLTAHVNGMLDNMYEIPAASATIRDGMRDNTSLTEAQATEATTYLYEYVFGKEGWQG